MLTPKETCRVSWEADRTGALVVVPSVNSPAGTLETFLGARQAHLPVMKRLGVVAFLFKAPGPSPSLHSAAEGGIHGALACSPGEMEWAPKLVGAWPASGLFYLLSVY